MNRREAMMSMTCAAVEMGTVSGQSILPDSVRRDRKAQYAICKVRGHAAGYPDSGNMVVPAVAYPERNAGFQTCKYCGTAFRFVTTMEEANQP